MCIRSTPAMLPLLQARCGQLTIIGIPSIADCLFLLPFWPSLYSSLQSASSASSFATTVFTTFPTQLSGDMEWYALSFVKWFYCSLRITTQLADYNPACGLQPSLRITTQLADYNLACGLQPSVRITTQLARIHTARCWPIQTTAFTSSTIHSFSPV